MVVLQKSFQKGLEKLPPVLVSRFSGFLEPEMQVAVVTYVAFMFSSSIFFSSLKSLWQVSSPVADKLSGKFFAGTAHKTRYASRHSAAAFGLLNEDA